MASVTVTIPNSEWGLTTLAVSWNPPNSQHISLGSDLSANMAIDVYLGVLSLPFTNVSDMLVQLSDGSGESDFLPGPDFSTQMETDGTIIIVASDDSTLTVTGISDSTDPYAWSPSNAIEVYAFANTLASLFDRSLTVTFNDNASPPPTTTYEVRVKATASGFTDSEYTAPVTIVV